MAHSVRRERLQINGCSLYLERRGSGPPLYALHGGPGLDHTTLAAGMERLEASYEVIYIDLRGHGLSERCEPSTCTFGQMADDLEEIRRAFGHERFSLLGHSMGAKVAILYALAHPRRLDGLVLMSANASPPRFARSFLTAHGRVRARLGLLGWAIGNAMRTLVGRPWSIERIWSEFWRRCWHLYSRQHNPPEEIGSLLLGALKPPLSALPPLMVELETVDLSRLLDQIRVRTLVLCGEEDVLFWNEQRSLCRIPGAHFASIPDAGHFPHLEQPELVAEVVDSFLCPGPDAA